VTIDELESHFEIGHCSAYDIILNRLGFRWLLFLNSSPKKKRTICQRLVDSYANECEAFLTRIVTGDETCVHHYAPESKRQSMDWKHPGSPVKKKYKSRLLREIFWDS